MWLVFMVMWFLFTAYAVTANDSVQTLGTFIEANKKRKWYILWAVAATLMVATLTYSYIAYSGDITFGRLEKISMPDGGIQWYHALAPISLIILTRFGVPVSTSLLVLSSFASSLVFEQIILKSFLGYGLWALCAFLIWIGFAKAYDKLDLKKKIKFKVSDRNWTIFQWLVTGFLWVSWLMHDMANIAVFLPRELEVWQFMAVCSVLVTCLWVIFYRGGWEIQQVVSSKEGIGNMRTATFVALLYAMLLIYFKEMNSLPMSTTWVFIWVLAGRELALTLITRGYSMKKAAPVLRGDMFKIMIGLVTSVSLVFTIQVLDWNSVWSILSQSQIASFFATIVNSIMSYFTWA